MRELAKYALGALAGGLLVVLFGKAKRDRKFLEECIQNAEAEEDTPEE